MDRDAAENARQLALFDLPGDPQTVPLRRLALAGRVVEYRFERRRRRTIGLRVDATGLAVSAPRRTPWREIEKFLRSSERWILARLRHETFFSLDALNARIRELLLPDLQFEVR